MIMIDIWGTVHPLEQSSWVQKFISPRGYRTLDSMLLYECNTSHYSYLRIKRTLEMMYYAMTNAGMHVTLNIACACCQHYAHNSVFPKWRCVLWRYVYSRISRTTHHFKCSERQVVDTSFGPLWFWGIHNKRACGATMWRFVLVRGVPQTWPYFNSSFLEIKWEKMLTHSIVKHTYWRQKMCTMWIYVQNTLYNYRKHSEQLCGHMYALHFKLLKKSSNPHKIKIVSICFNIIKKKIFQIANKFKAN